MKKILTALLICALMLPLFALYPPGDPAAPVEEVGQGAVEPLGSSDYDWESRYGDFSNVPASLRSAVIGFYEDIYDPEAIVRWWAGLYDPDLGGFYYANSARDTEGFLPDMESTYQISQHLKELAPYYKGQKNLRLFYGETLSNKIRQFYLDMYDSATGYYYHPQWSREVSNANVMRRTRDKDWAKTMTGWLEPLNTTSTFDVTVQRLASSAKLTKRFSENENEWGPDTVPAITAYVNNLLATQTCENWANTLQTQAKQLIEARLLGTVLDLLEARINSTYGLWTTGRVGNTNVYYNLKTTPTEESLFGMLTCTYKVAMLYQAYNGEMDQAEDCRPIPEAMKMVERAIEGIKINDPGARVTYRFNPWATLGTIWENLRDCHGRNSSEVNAYLARISTDIVTMLNVTKQCLEPYRHADGSYSFLQSGSAAVVNGTPVSLGRNEGDVNATNLVLGLAKHICHAVGANTVGVLCHDDGELMLELMENAPSIVKIQKPDLTFENDFTNDPLNEFPEYADEWSGESTTFRVVEEPGNTSNKVLKIEKIDEDGKAAGIIELPLLSAPLVDDGSVLEFSMRIKVAEGSRFGNGAGGSYANLMQIRFTCGGRAFWMPSLRFNRSSNTPTAYDIVVGKNTSGSGATEFPGGNNAEQFALGEWHEFTFRLTVKNYLCDNAEFRAAIYVDGEYYGTSRCFFDPNHNGIDQGDIQLDHGQPIRVRLALQKRTHATVYVDDLKATYTRSDVCRNFSDDELGVRPANTTVNAQTGTTFKVIGEPGNTGNKVLEIKKDTETNVSGGALNVPLFDVPTMNNGTTIEVKMRLNVSSESRYGTNSTGGNHNLMQMRFMCNSTTFWMPTLQFNRGTNTPNGYYLAVGKNISSYYANYEFPDDKENLFCFDTWYEFTFRLTFTQFGSAGVFFKADIYVDDEYFGTSICFYADDDYSSFTSGTVNFTEGQTFRIRFSPQSRAHALIYVDDLRASYLHDDAFFDFSDDTIGSLPAGAVEAAASGTTFQVIDEAGNSGNRIVEINKNTEANVNGGTLTLPVADIPEWDDTAILEIGMRLNVSSASRFGNSATGTNNHRNLMQMRFMCGNTPFWMPTLRFSTGSNPTSGYKFVVGKNTSSTLTESPDGQSRTFAFDTWYEFTFRVFVKDLGGSDAQFHVDIYVDGEYFGTSYCFYATDDYSSLTSGTILFRDESVLKIRFAPQMRTHALIYVDDVSANYTRGN